MRTPSRQNMAGAVARWLVALLHTLRLAPRGQPISPILDEGDLAQRVRLSGEW